MAIRVYSSSTSSGTFPAIPSRSAVAAFEFLVLLAVLRLHLFLFCSDGLLGFFQIRFRPFHPPVHFFQGHHLVQHLVFRLGHFRFGIRDFVQQRLVRFVGFHRSGLLAVLLRPPFPLLRVQLQFLALSQPVGVRLFRRCHRRAGSVQLRIGLAQLLRQSVQLRAQRRDDLVQPLQFQ